MRTISVTVDVIGELRNTKKTFADIYCFVDEIVQNAQRARAKHVWLEGGEDERGRYIRFRDDGSGCGDFRTLFRKACSGWSKEVVEEEEPFGAGFFATMVVADRITVESRGKRAIFDAKKMFETGDTRVITVEPLPTKEKGFQVELRGIRDDLEDGAMNRRFKDLVRYLPICGHLGTDEVEHVDPLVPTAAERKEHEPFLTVVNEGGYRGILWPTDSPNVASYYQGRYVERLYIQGLGGRVFVDKGTLNPRAPDRKQWIRDSAWYKFDDVLEAKSKEILLHVVREGTDEEIEGLSYAIDGRLSAADYAAFLRYDILEDQQVIDFVRKRKDEVEGLSFEEIQEKMEAEARELAAERSAIESADKPDVVLGAKPPASTDPTPAPTAKSRGKKTGETLVKDEEAKPFAWVEAAEFTKHLEEILEAAHYGVRVVVGRNRLHLKALQKAANGVHISKLGGALQRIAVATNRFCIGSGEERAKWLFDLCETACLSACEDRVEICDLSVYQQYEIAGKPVGKREERKGVIAIAYGKKVYIDRSHFDFDALRAPYGLQSSGVAEADHVFLVRVIDVLAEEFAHLLGERDATVPMLTRKVEFMRSMLQAMFPKRRAA